MCQDGRNHNQSVALIKRANYRKCLMSAMSQHACIIPITVKRLATSLGPTG